MFVTGQEQQAHAVRAKDPLGRHRIGLTDEARSVMGRAGRWISGKFEAQRRKICVCREGKEAGGSTTAKVRS